LIGQKASRSLSPAIRILTPGDLQAKKAVSLVRRRVVEVPVNPSFPLGQVVATPAALKLVPPEVLRKRAVNPMVPNLF
jgi:hypothetical protein